MILRILSSQLWILSTGPNSYIKHGQRLELINADAHAPQFAGSKTRTAELHLQTLQVLDTQS